ncbi:hypothetical protein [Raoultella ornithinolytica]|nr:hypothetical protein [Raoultella ornithinolytica]
MSLNLKPKKNRKEPLTLEEALRLKAARMKETHDFFQRKGKEKLLSEA